MPSRVRHHTDDAGLEDIRKANAIVSGRGWGVVATGLENAGQIAGSDMGPVLARRTIIELAFGFAEAERSTHRVLDPAAAWSEFQAYYSPEKKDWIKGLFDSLARHAARTAQASPALTGDRFFESLGPPGLFRILWGSLSARWKSHWAFSTMEVGFMASSWRAFLRLLEMPQKPDADSLIVVRKNLCLCGYIFDWRCCGMREVKQRRFVSHFRQTKWLRKVQLEDLLKGAA